MEKVLTVIQVIAPIFLTMCLGMFARRRNILASVEIEGIQRFVVKFCLPCLVFRSCVTADITPQALSSMALLPPIQILGILWAFRARKKLFPYHNLPFLYVCKETGMLGIPLFMILFGSEQAYRMGVLDLTQAPLAFMIIGILSSDSDANVSAKAVIRQIVTSPLILLGVLGMVLNLSGIWDVVTSAGVAGIVEDCVSFLSEPVSAVMLFCVGYNFTMNKDSRTDVFKLSAIHIGYFALAGVVVQGALFLVPGVDALTRWAAALYFLLPASYLTPGLGREQKDFTVASGVASVTTVFTLMVFCVFAALVV